MARPRLTALIVARDEEANLPGCLDSLGFADEVVVVVDARTRDATLAIARDRAARARLRPFDDFARQRNAALAMATGDWVLAIDADERVTPGLAAEIRLAMADPRNPHAGYEVPIRSVILGRPFVGSGTQDDRPVRLFRRGHGRWVGEVHETVDLDGPPGRLTGWLDHRTIPDIHTFLKKINRYTSLEARKRLRAGDRPRRFDLTFRPLWTFAKLYLAKGGFRDGPEGFVFCALSAVSAAVRQWKLRELVRARAARHAARPHLGGTRRTPSGEGGGP
jgi:glycosyltransferase involved in cell wall biosynthesis